MRLVLATVLVAALVGALAGGRLSDIGRLSIRWSGLALVGLALQVMPLPRAWLLAALIVSFGLLLVFAVFNVRVPGFPLILIGTLLNLSVILVNGGMPVGAQALAASGQQDTLTALVHSGGAKHHLADSDDRLLFLADTLSVPQPLGQAFSAGDVFTYVGVGWVLVAGMVRGPNRRRVRSSSAEGASGVRS